MDAVKDVDRYSVVTSRAVPPQITDYPLYPYAQYVASTDVIIPAYDDSGTGLIVDLKLTVFRKNTFKIHTSGAVAQALRKMLQRTAEIMASLKMSWHCLKTYDYHLTAAPSKFCVQDARSAGLPICIALLNILRTKTGKKQKNSLVGTGILRIDGSFEESALEDKKHLALHHSNQHNTTLITSQQCHHVFELEHIIYHKE